MSGIYGLYCRVTGKWYVGETINNIVDRWNDYRIFNCKRPPKIYYALKKYGYDNFDKVIIEECKPDQDILNLREDFWINEKNSILNGYNCKQGGSHGKFSLDSNIRMAISKTVDRNPWFCKKLTAYYKFKISSFLRGKIRSEKHCLSLSKRIMTDEWRSRISSSSRLSSKHHFYPELFTGWRHTEETKMKMRDIKHNRPDMSSESRLKISEYRIGKKHSEEIKRKISASVIGRKRSDEIKNKISISMLNRNYIQK
jgi:group I intron endonuclease